MTGAGDNLGVVSVEYGSAIIGTYAASSCTLVADDGGTDTLTSIPAVPLAWNLYVTNGTTADLGGVDTLGAVTLDNGNITDGTINSSASYALQNGAVSATCRAAQA